MERYNKFIEELDKLLHKYKIEKEDVYQIFNMTCTKLLIINLEKIIDYDNYWLPPKIKEAKAMAVPLLNPEEDVRPTEIQKAIQEAVNKSISKGMDIGNDFSKIGRTIKWNRGEM